MCTNGQPLRLEPRLRAPHGVLRNSLPEQPCINGQPPCRHRRDEWPDAFARFIDSVLALKFDEEPRYEAYRALFEPITGEAGGEPPIRLLCPPRAPTPAPKARMHAAARQLPRMLCVTDGEAVHMCSTLYACSILLHAAHDCYL
jgi:hypothetical protein